MPRDMFKGEEFLTREEQEQESLYSETMEKARQEELAEEAAARRRRLKEEGTARAAEESERREREEEAAKGQRTQGFWEKKREAERKERAESLRKFHEEAVKKAKETEAPPMMTPEAARYFRGEEEELEEQTLEGLFEKAQETGDYRELEKELKRIEEGGLHGTLGRIYHSKLMGWLTEKEKDKRGRPVGPSRGEKIGKGIWGAMVYSGKPLAGGVPAKRALAPSMSPAGQALAPGMVPAGAALATGMTPLGALHGMMGVPREMMMPPNLRPAEQAAFSEIHANGDQDTRRNVTDDLARQGFSRQEAGMAVTSLEKKGHIEKTGLAYDGSPEYQITIQVGRR